MRHHGILTHGVVDGVLVGETVQRAVQLSHLGVDTEVPGGQEVRPGSAESQLSSLPALREKLGRNTKVETVEAGQGVGAGDPLVATATPVIRLGEVIPASGGEGAAHTFLHLGRPQVNLGQQEEEEKERGLEQ